MYERHESHFCIFFAYLVTPLYNLGDLLFTKTTSTLSIKSRVCIFAAELQRFRCRAGYELCHTRFALLLAVPFSTSYQQTILWNRHGEG